MLSTVSRNGDLEMLAGSYRMMSATGSMITYWSQSSDKSKFIYSMYLRSTTAGGVKRKGLLLERVRWLVGSHIQVSRRCGAGSVPGQIDWCQALWRAWRPAQHISNHVLNWLLQALSASSHRCFAAASSKRYCLILRIELIASPAQSIPTGNWMKLNKVL